MAETLAAAVADPNADSAIEVGDEGSAPRSRDAAEMFTTEARLVQPKSSPVLVDVIVSPSDWS